MYSFDEFVKNRTVFEGLSVLGNPTEKEKATKQPSKVGMKGQTVFMKTHSGLTKAGWELKGQSVKDGIRRLHYRKGEEEKIVIL